MVGDEKKRSRRKNSMFDKGVFAQKFPRFNKRFREASGMESGQVKLAKWSTGRGEEVALF